MLPKPKFLLITLIFVLALSACSPNAQTTSSPTTPYVVNPATLAPTTTTKAVPITSPSPSEVPAPPLAMIQMVDTQAGWAWSATGRLLNTADGGQTWIDRTPEGYQQTDSGFFLDGQTAWLPVYLPDSNRFGLLYTADGGESWAEYPQGLASGLHFSDALNGWAVSGDVGAGNVYFYLSQTSDGGKTWAPIPVKPQESESGLPPGTIHLCNICNDAFYYDPGRMIIIYGDLGSMEPRGSVSMEVSFDLGNNWQKETLPLPQAESDALVSPNPPIFYNDRDGLLPVHLVKMNPDGSYGEQRIIFYSTSDGGASWSLLPAKLDDVPLYRSIQVASSQDAFTICGNALCVSHDLARTWQHVTSDLDFSSSDTHSISALDFISDSTGWVLVLKNETTSLYKTIDGGVHWTLMIPLLIPSYPPTVIIDTSIPTPTPIPTPTLEPTSTPNVVYDPQVKADRVKFALYATWVELSGATSHTGDVRYVLSAQEGQVMSVSIRQGPAFSVEVAGADKKPLTDSRNPQPYWRGVLPSTQDYFITVKSQVEAPFDLRIAINPPGQSTQNFGAFSAQYAVALSYSDEFAPVNYQFPFDIKGTPLATLYFIDPSFYYPTTNLIESALMLTVSTDSNIVATCTEIPARSGETIIGEVSINGYIFTQSEFVGAAAGNKYEQIFYRTVWQDKCFEVIFLIHSSNIQNYPAGSVVEFDRNALLAKFEAVLATFTAK